MKLNTILRNGQYFRGTDNGHEEILVHNKQLRPSTNQLSGARERGISVSDTDDVRHYFRYLYILTGNEVGIGSDGEPLLDPKTIQFVRWVVSP